MTLTVPLQVFGRIQRREQTILCFPLPSTGAPNLPRCTQVDTRHTSPILITVLDTRVMQFHGITYTDMRRLGYETFTELERAWSRRLAREANPWVYLVDFH